MAAGSGAGLLRPQDSPFVARDAELRLLAEAIERRDGAVVVGPAGVGKTRLVREAFDRACGAGHAGTWVIGTRSAQREPYAAVAHVAGVQPAAHVDATSLYDAVAASLRTTGVDLLVVDDAQLLDAGSASLVLHLALSGAVTVVATVRRGEDVPDPITALWKDDLAVRIDLAPFTAVETADLLQSTLDGEVEASTAYRLAEVTGGNALYVRELVAAAVGAGSLCLVDGVWGWDGTIVVAPRLADAVGDRLADLQPDARDALALVALGEPLPLAVLEQLARPTALSGLERAGLVRTDRQGRCRLSHPLYGEVVVHGLGRSGARATLRRLADAVEQALGRSDERIVSRVAVWRLDAGSEPEGRQLVAAARFLNDAFDFQQAERIARAAIERGGGVPAAVALGRALTGMGRYRDAEDCLAAVEPDVIAHPDPRMRRVYLDRRLTTLHHGLGRGTDALAVLDRFEAVHDAGSRHLVTAWRASLALDAGDLTEAVMLANRVLTPDGVDDPSQMLAAATAGEALIYLGRTDQARDVHDRLGALTRSGSDESAHAAWSLALQDVMCLLQDGPLDVAMARVEQAHATCAASPDPVARGVAAFAVGATAMRAGRPLTARRALHEAARLQRDVDVNGHLAWTYAMLAQAEAQLGSARRAEEALDRASAAQPARPPMRSRADMVLAEAWTAAVRGDVSRAARLAVEGADGMREMVVHQARVWYAALRLREAPRRVADHLQRLAGDAPARLVQVCAQHATAVADRDPAALEEASSALEAFGMVLEAAEAAADASRLHTGSTARARAAARCRTLAARCEGAQTPALQLDVPARDLTRRELDIARLAAQGLTSPEIAARLVVSVRTVESHLYRAFGKLGVTRREELPSALRGQGP